MDGANSEQAVGKEQGKIKELPFEQRLFSTEQVSSFLNVDWGSLGFLLRIKAATGQQYQKETFDPWDCSRKTWRYSGSDGKENVDIIPEGKMLLEVTNTNPSEQKSRADKGDFAIFNQKVRELSGV